MPVQSNLNDLHRSLLNVQISCIVYICCCYCLTWRRRWRRRGKKKRKKNPRTNSSWQWQWQFFNDFRPSAQSHRGNNSYQYVYIFTFCITVMLCKFQLLFLRNLSVVDAHVTNINKGFCAKLEAPPPTVTFPQAFNMIWPTCGTVLTGGFHNNLGLPCTSFKT